MDYSDRPEIERIILEFLEWNLRVETVIERNISNRPYLAVKVIAGGVVKEDSIYLDVLRDALNEIN